MPYSTIVHLWVAPLLVRLCCELIVPQELLSSLTVAIRGVNNPQTRPKQTLICFSILPMRLFEEFLEQKMVAQSGIEPESHLEETKPL
jgi:hypothetical protein